MIATVENGHVAAVEPKPIEVLKQTVSASRLNCWLQCRLKFWFRYVLKITKPKTAALHYGSVLHLVLQQWNLNRWRKQPFDLTKLKLVFEAGWQDQAQIQWDGEEPEQKNSAWAVLEKYFSEYLATVYPEAKEPEKMELVKRDRSWSEYFFDQGRGNRLPGVAGSLWAAFNGVTEWVDHRKSRQNENQRLVSTWFGGSYQTKARAFGVAQDKMLAWN